MVPTLPLLRGPTPAHCSRFLCKHLLHISAQQEATLPSSSSSSSSKQCPWLIVGLGNPGKLYQGTRHNVGFEMIDAIAEVEGIKLKAVQHRALVGKGEIGGAQVLLAKPMTFVNLSGQSVGPLAASYHIPLQQILVVFDDMDLEFAVMRLLPKGGHGGHNGMKSIIQCFKDSREFPRLRIGIGRPPGSMSPQVFVLKSFNKTEREVMDISIAHGMNAIRKVVTEGIDKAVSTCNQTRKSRV